MLITSGQNKAVKQLRALSMRKGREKSGLFVVEGSRAVFDALEKGADISYILVREDFDREVNADCQIFTLPAKLFDRISETYTPQGILAVCRAKRQKLKDIKIAQNKAVIVCDGVQDPGNVGTIIRTADAVGAAGVILTKGCADLYNPKTVRATMSSIFSLPIVDNADISDSLAYIKSCGARVVVGALDGSALDIFDAQLSGAAALVVGNEGNGVSQAAIDCADCVVKIPMNGGAESLNVTIACGVMAYEHLRQNR